MTSLATDALIVRDRHWVFGGQRYDAGDLFDWKARGADQRRVRQIVELPSRPVVILTRQAMLGALKARSPDAPPPRGFTPAGLVAQGLLTEEEVVTFGWAAAPPAPKANEPPPPPYAPPAGSTAVGDLYVIPAKTNGGPARYDIVDAKGARVNVGGTIMGQAKAEARAHAIIEARAAV